ncbi:MAG: response regulator transcription factor [Myxococcota bacterium]|nr:response regulator transcription factor [Myxococcota bacterium]
MAQILLVEDDPRSVELLRELLEGSGHQVRPATTLQAAREAFSPEIELVVLDLNLPDGDGFSLCVELRARSAVPILILSARGGADDRVDGLRLGADDFLPKPYAPSELLARIDAIGRRREWAVGGAPVVVGDLELDPGARSAQVAGRDLGLTETEFDVLRVLAERAGRVVTRERLSLLARGAEWGAFDRSLDVHVSRIRKKLGDDARIRTLRGVGYMLVSR